uniref:Uncharacterized protein n=1 Tax=Plectus sambesii TaxID=2011161 RepID=A0A914US56_9BILA
MLYEAERAWEPGLTQISTFHSEESEDWIAMKNFLVPNIERFNITLEQLKSVLDGKFCSLPEGNPPYNQLLRLAYFPSGKTECIAGSKISFIGVETICFRLIGYQNYLHQLGTTELVYSDPYNDGKDQAWCQEMTIDLGSESRSTPRRATTRNETHTYYYNRFFDPVYINMDIGIKALYRKLPYVKGDIQCSSDTSREECENKCLRGWIMAHCHCWPITFNLTGKSEIA